jgi:hypothetical protein
MIPNSELVSRNSGTHLSADVNSKEANYQNTIKPSTTRRLTYQDYEAVSIAQKVKRRPVTYGWQ